jgi:hypothetical protein
MAKGDVSLLISGFNGRRSPPDMLSLTSHCRLKPNWIIQEKKCLPNQSITSIETLPNTFFFLI